VELGHLPLVEEFAAAQRELQTVDTEQIGRFVVDETGKRTKVILDIEDYEKLLEALEEAGDIRACDELKASNEEAIPLEQAIEEIERRKK